MDLFNKAMKEYNQTNPASAMQPSESKEKICNIKNFYDAMTTYINSKKPKEICLHACTIKKNGWETCLDCRLRLSRIFTMTHTLTLEDATSQNQKKVVTQKLEK